jgi:hypothetical protein
MNEAPNLEVRNIAKVALQKENAILKPNKGLSLVAVLAG